MNSFIVAAMSFSAVLPMIYQ